MSELLHKAARDRMTWEVRMLTDSGVLPPKSVALAGLTGLPEALAQAICVALEEAKPGFYFIQSEQALDD
jgi:hypothetical protein